APAVIGCHNRGVRHVHAGGRSECAMPVLFLLSCAAEPEPAQWYDDMSCQGVDDSPNLPVASEGDTLYTQVELDVAANASANGSELNFADCQSTNREVIDPAQTWWDVCGDWVAIA